MRKYKKIIVACISVMLATDMNASISFAASSNQYHANTQVTITYDGDEKTPVIIRYVDENGNIIAESTAIFGKDGESYEVSAIKIRGYELKEVQGNTKGVIGEDDTVTFIYRKINNASKEDGQGLAANNKDNKGGGNDNQNKNNNSINNTAVKDVNTGKNTDSTDGLQSNNAFLKDDSSANNALKNNGNVINGVKTGDPYLLIIITAAAAVLSGITGFALKGKHRKNKCNH